MKGDVLMSKNRPPLQGVRVLELCHVVAGPYASMYLAMMGAEVIKIENPKTQGDLCRQTGPLTEHGSVRFCALNHNKQSVTLDLSTETGAELFLRLVETADVVMDNFRPGVLDRLGVGYDAMKQVNPKIVYGNLSGFGTYGPYRNRPAFDMIAQALSGIMMINGNENDSPMKIGTSMADILAGINLVVGVLAGLHKAETTGEGCFVETSLVDSLVSAMTMEHINYFYHGETPRRIGNDYREWCPAGAFQAQDGWFVLATGSEKNFRSLAACMGQTDWLEDDTLTTHASRVQRRCEINDAINRWGSERTVEEVCSLLQNADVPCSPVNEIPDVAKDPHISSAREMFCRYEQPGIGTLTATNIPLRFHDCPPVPLSAAPQMGQNTYTVLRDILKLSDRELTDLLAE